MTRRPLSCLAALAACALAACSAINPFRLEDQVALYHDDLRWGRIQTAQQQVAPNVRPQFERQHSRWGREVQIVDMEVEPARMSGLTGSVRARYMWTRPAETEIRETIVETRWRSGFSGGWAVDEERVIAGDPTLLAAAPPRASGSTPPSAAP